MIPALASDVAEQEEVPDGEHSSSDVAATHDERERPRHRHDEYDGHDRQYSNNTRDERRRRAAAERAHRL